MNIAGIAGIGLIGAVLSLVLRQYKPEFALAVSILTGVFILGAVLSGIAPVVGLLENLADKCGMGRIYVGVL